MHGFRVLSEPVRRRLLELMVDGERTAGDLTNVVRAELGVSQPAVSQHLKVLRDNGFATVRVGNNRRYYAVDPTGLEEVDGWFGQFRPFEAYRNHGAGPEG